MLFAVGGGFFSSSASGYSKGLSVLLLGQRNKDKPMRVSPWNHYQLVDQESDLDLQLASTKNRLSSGCTSLVCFGRTSDGLNAPPLQVGPAKERDVPPENVVPEVDKDHSTSTDDEMTRKTVPRSSLKKQPKSSSEPGNGTNESGASGENGVNIQGHAERKKVQWTDAYGSELVEIREFEPSEVGGSDDEFDGGNEKSCSCVIM